MRKLLIPAAAVVLLGLGVVLWRMTQDTDEVSAAPSQKRPPPPASAPTPAPSAARDAHLPTTTTVRPQPRTPTAAPSAPSAAAPEVAPPAAAKDQEPPERVDLKLQLRKQLDAIDSYVTDCVTSAAKSGSKPKGAANLLFKAFKVKGKTVITEASVEPLDTTIKDPGDKALLDCLAATSKKIQLDLPDGVNNILATHQVDLDSGAVVQDKLSALYLNEPVP